MSESGHDRPRAVARDGLPIDDDARERELLRRLDAGDRRAAEALVEHTYGDVYAGLVRLTGGDTDLAADLTQDTYRKAWQSIDRFDRRSRLGTWLYRIAYNTFLNHVRRTALVQPFEEAQVDRLSAPEPGQHDQLATRRRGERLRRAVMALPEPFRYAITAHYWGEVPVRELAEAEEITGAAIRKRLKTARERLRLDLEEDPS